jgi:ABC-type phosphate/phosphonate transport system substrate-binding protein
MDPKVRRLPTVHAIIGKHSIVESDAKEIGRRVRPLAMLSDKDGAVTLTGLFIVRTADEAQSIEDLDGRTILFGPKDSDEKHTAALVVCPCLVY